MPSYNGAIIPSSIAPGDVVIVWNNEQPVAGAGGASASVQLAIARKSVESLTPFAVDLDFAAAPGAFEVDVQVSQEDLDNEYQTVLNGNIVAVDAINQTAHFVANVENAKFVRLLMRSRTNAVNVTATIAR